MKCSLPMLMLLVGTWLTSCGQNALAAGGTIPPRFTAPVPFETLPPNPSMTIATAVRVGESPPLSALQQPSPTPPVVPEADVVVQQARGPVYIRVGQTAFVVAPQPFPEWDVKFDPVLVVILSPADPSRLGNSKGWLLRALAAGTTHLSFTSRAPACEVIRPCPSMPTMSLELTLVILP